MVPFVLAGYYLAVFSQPYSTNLVVTIGVFGLLFFGTSFLAVSVDEWVLRQRGEVTTCTVGGVTRRVVITTDSEGRTSTYIVYDYRLACADPRVEEMTFRSRVADAGDRIEVAHDPAGRLDPRPAASVRDAWSLRLGAALFGAGMVGRLLIGARLLSEMNR